jgi:hypothetical protein
VVERVLEQWCQYLGERIGGSPSAKLQLPVIPLGVDCDAFDRSEGPELREAARQKWQIEPADVVFLFAGRLSHHAKAHPLPMFLALEQAAHRTKRRVHLLLAGRFANSAIEEQFRSSAKAYCPSVKVHFLDGSSSDDWPSMWQAADVFTSLSDNIQETFGLTPVEAMAAGLPVVVSDWDGYRDTVRDGIDGFRIPTLLPPPGTGADLVERYELGLDPYDRYVGNVSQFTAVDISACAEAYLRLIENASLRRSMGESGRRRARECFDWRVIIAAYQELWQELASRRQAAAAAAPRAGRSHPLREDPFALFGTYASRLLTPETVLCAPPVTGVCTVDELRDHPLANFASPLMGTADECRSLLTEVQQRSQSLWDLLERFDTKRRRAATRSLAWLLKFGLLEVRAAQSAPGKDSLTRQQLVSLICEAGSDDLRVFGGRWKGGYLVQQIPEELADLILLLRRFEPFAHTLEIGIAAGGTTRLIREQVRMGRTVVIDNGKHWNFPAWQTNKLGIDRLDEFIGNSHSAAAREFLAGLACQFDYAAIDGDHSYKGVLSDWQLVRPYLADGAIVWFHDINLANPEFGVQKLWRETLAKDHEVLLETEGRCGIGVIRVRNAK